MTNHIETGSAKVPQRDPIKMEKLEKKFPIHNFHVDAVRFRPEAGSIVNTVANILVMMKVDFGSWQDFTFGDYERFCNSHHASPKDVAPKDLDDLVERGFLELNGEHYSITEKFFEVASALAD